MNPLYRKDFLIIYAFLLLVLSVPSFAAKCIEDPHFDGTNNPQMNAPYFKHSMGNNETGPPTHWKYPSIRLTWNPYEGGEFDGYKIMRKDGNVPYAKLTNEAEPVLDPEVTSAIRTNVASLYRDWEVYVVRDGVMVLEWAEVFLT